MDCAMFFSRHLASLFGGEVKITLDVILLDDLQCDVPYQRSLKPNALKRMMADQLNPIAAGLLVVNERKNGVLYLIDGNHRKTMLAQKQITKWPCLVAHGLTEPQEAALWQAFNGKRTTVHTVERLNAQVCAKEKAALELREIVHRCGFRFPFDSADAFDGVEIQAIESIQYAKSLGFLEDVLQVVGAAWPGDKESVGGMIIKGVVAFLRSPGMNGRIRKEKLVKALAAKPPKQLVFDSKGVGTSDGNVSVSIARKIAEGYNRGLPESEKVKVVWRPGLRTEDLAE